MDWLTECDVDLSTGSQKEGMDIRIQKIEGTEKINKSYNILTEFFVSLTAKGSNSLTSIFLNEPNIPQVLLEAVVSHFDDRKMVFEDNIITELMLSQPKTSSIDYIMHRPGNPVIKSLYDINTPMKETNEWTPRKAFRVKCDKIERYDNKDFDNILPYLKATDNQPFVFLNIYDWSLSESLNENLAIRYFSHKCSELYLWIDQNQKVTNIQLEFDNDSLFL